MIIIALLAEGEGTLKLFRSVIRMIVTATPPPHLPPPTQCSRHIFSEGIIRVDQNGFKRF
jgi:hypothetical protein